MPDLDGITHPGKHPLQLTANPRVVICNGNVNYGIYSKSPRFGQSGGGLGVPSSGSTESMIVAVVYKNIQIEILD